MIQPRPHVCTHHALEIQCRWPARDASSMILRLHSVLLFFVFCVYSLRCVTLDASGSGADICQECPVGTFANRTNENCSGCIEGFCKGTDFCSLCSPGTHGENAGMTSCIPCSLGSVCNDTGCVMCTECLAGTAAKNGRTCDKCAVGKNSSKNGSTECEACPSGLICNTTGCTVCFPCPAGHQPNRMTPSHSCQRCPPGDYRASNTGPFYFCRPCQTGYYQDKEGQTECFKCPEGHFCPDPSSPPRQCPVGTHCPAGSTHPIECHSLFSYDQEHQVCVPQGTFYVMVVSVIIVFCLIVLLVVVATYWNMCHKKRQIDYDAKVPLVPNKKQDLVYSGL